MGHGGGPMANVSKYIHFDTETAAPRRAMTRGLALSCDERRLTQALSSMATELGLLDEVPPRPCSLSLRS